MSPTQNNSAETDPSRPSLEDAIINHPGAVKINVQGAYIVDDQPPTPESPAEEDGIVYERKDIRLPHHTSVVSHVAVDVSRIQLLLRHFPAISSSSVLAEIQLPTCTSSYKAFTN